MNAHQQEAGEPPFRTIAIVGVGLIGGSIGLAARARWGVRVIGIDRTEVVREAISLGAVDEAGADLASAAPADLVVLAAPVAVNLSLVREIWTHLPQTTVVTDVSSTKRAIVAAAAGRRQFVGGHPLSGAAVSGVGAAREGLFRGRPWILTPDAGTPADVLSKLTRFVQGLGAIPERLDAETHDRLMAYVSHLPQVVASTLLDTIGRSVGDYGLALSGPGLADTTRLASSPGDLWAEILASNAEHVGPAVDDLIEALRRLRDRLHDGTTVSSTFASAARWRRSLRLVGEASRGEPSNLPPAPRHVPATRTYLEMTERPPAAAPAVALERLQPCPPHFYRYLYREVGRPWHWLDRLSWTDEQIRKYLSADNLEVLTFSRSGAPAGFAELRRDDDGSVEIVYFGLMPEFIGCGLGGPFLAAVVQRAWEGRTKRVWLHTCTLDHPNALPNYLRAGFRVTREEQYLARLEA
ncbi:MAG TPA: prephenate dehydrogenase/arogenate dehydrogenase family protein [Vicinamibacterales bacterium]